MIPEEAEPGELGEAEGRLHQRERTMKSLTGEWTPPRKSHSSTSLTSHDRPHTPVLFAAHKAHHLFGAPSQQQQQARKRGPLRDVFAVRDDDWVDEGEDLEGYGGGLGQSKTEEPEPGPAGSPVPTRSFESRYAGVPGARTKFQGSTLIVEEEEEEEEE